MSSKDLPMRNGVGVRILNKDHKVFVGKRKDNPIDRWQMLKEASKKVKLSFCYEKRTL